MNTRRLYRSRDRQLAGVAGGMAEYLDVDPTVVRILWILAGIASAGLALLAYLALALVVPQAPWVTAPVAPVAPAPGGWAPTSAAWTPAPPAAPVWNPDYAASADAEARARQRARSRGIGAGAIVGVVLIVFGAVALADAAFPGWAGAVAIGPAVVIALGAALLVSSIRRTDDPVDASASDAAPVAPVAPVEPVEPSEPAAGWDVTDTQAVDPTAFGQPAAPAGEESRRS